MRVFLISTGVVLTAVIVVYLSFCFNSYFYPLQYESQIKEYSLVYDLDPAFVAGIINTESKFDALAVSSKGAVGLMQIMPATGKFIADKLNIKFNEVDLFNPQMNIMFGCYYLNYLAGKFENLDCVVASYNAGEGNVRSWLSSIEYSSDGKKLTNIPFKETKDYVNRVNKSYSHYKHVLK